MNLRILPILIILVLVLAVPVSAGNYTITGVPYFSGETEKTFWEVDAFDLDLRDQDMRYFDISMRAPLNTDVNFTLYYANGETVEGVITYHQVSLFDAISYYSLKTICLGGSCNSLEFLDVSFPMRIYTPDTVTEIAGYGLRNSDNATGFLLYDSDYGSLNDLAAFYEIPEALNQNMIYRVSITSTQGLTVWVRYADKKTVGERINEAAKNPVEIALDLLEKAKEYTFDFIDFFLIAVYWLKFFFVDHYKMVLVIYGTVTAAVAANTARDIFDFFRRFFKMQKAIAEFAIGVASWLVGMIANLIGIYKLFG